MLDRLTCAAVCTAVVTFAAGGTAHAAGPGGWQPSQWITATCATAAVTTAAAGSDGDLIVHAEATQCGSPVPGAEAALVFFDPAAERARVTTANMWGYGTTSPNASGAVLRRAPGVVGVCVMGNFTWRIACAEITVAGNSATLRPIEPTDPLVATEVDRQVYQSEDPECGSCF